MAFTSNDAWWIASVALLSMGMTALLLYLLGFRPGKNKS